METAVRVGPRALETPADPASTGPVEAVRTLAVQAIYHLSEEGRKAALLAGQDGRAVQQVTLHVPANRLHLVAVNAQGQARLKLRPRYDMNGDQRIVRVDAAPIYDAPPTLDDLFRQAARNHELERVYLAERGALRARRRETDRDRRAQIAQAFLNDPAQRALAHPPPNPKRCVLVGEHGRMVFDIATDDGAARLVPPEAHRRFRTDLRARDQRRQEQRAAELAVHQEKTRLLAEWIAAHGTPDQQARQAAGLLPVQEALESMADHTFAVLDHCPRTAFRASGRI
jgi:hypothetical protein